MNRSFYLQLFVSFVALATVTLLWVIPAQAQFNEQINYQGRLLDSTGSAVADGTYAMSFRLYTVATSGSAIWTETLSGASEVTVIDGLFSVMLGSTTPLSSVDFNQTLYLGVTIEADSEMAPRKILGAVPAAFFAKEADNANTVGGVASTSFLRNDQAGTVTASSSSSIFSVIQNGFGKIASFFSGATEVFTILNNGNVGIGTTTPESRLAVAGNAVIGGNLTATGTLSVGTLNGLLLGTSGTVSAVATSGLNIAIGDTIGTLSATRGGTGLTTITQNQLLIGGAGNTWTQVATTTLGLATPFSNSAQLAALLSDETGSTNNGVAVFSYAPTFTGLSSFGSTTNSGLLTVAGTTTLATSTIASSTIGTLNLTNALSLAMGGTGATTAGGARTNLGATTIGSNIFTLTNPSSSTILRLNADNTVSALSTSSLNIDLGNTVGILGATRGGTGLTSYATGDLIYASGANTLANRTIGSTGNVLSVVGGVPTWVATSTFNINTTNLTGLGTNVATFLGTPSSANLAAALTDETGTGNIVLSNAPTFTGLTTFASTTNSGLLTVAGTSSLATTTVTDLTIARALRDTTGSAGTAGMVLQTTGTTTRWVATSTLGLGGSGSIFASDIDTSAKLAGILSDETGSAGGGLAVFSNAPTFTGITNFADIIAANATTTNASTTQLAISSLTNGRLAYVGTGGRLIDSTNLLFDGSRLATLNLAVTGTSTFATSTVATSTITSLTLGNALAVTSGGTGATTQSGARTNLGATTIGSNIFTLTNPSSSTILRLNADNTVSALSTSSLNIDLGNTVGTLGGTRGGTGLTSYATGDLIYASGANTLANRTIGSTGNVLSVVGGVPTWVATSTFNINTTNLTGLGTNVATFLGTPSSANLAAALTDETGATNGGVAVFSYAPTFTGLASFGSTTNSGLLTVAGTSTLATTTIASSTIGTLNLTNALSLAMGGTGATTAAGARTNLGATTIGSNIFTLTNPSSSTILRLNADNTVSALSTSSLNIDLGNTVGTLGATRGGTGLTSYSTGDLIYASGANTLANRTIGSTGNVLSVVGGVPTWVSTSSLNVSSGASTFLALTDTPSSFTANRIMFTNSGATALTDSADFTFDGTNLGLGGAQGIAWNGTRYLYASSTNDAISFGENAGAGFGATNLYNIALGFEAGRFASTTNASYNILTGYQAGRNLTGTSSILIGREAGSAMTGSQNIVLGNNSGTNAGGTSNSFFGNNIGANLLGSSNVAIGGNNFINGSPFTINNNVAIGYRAGALVDGNGNNNILIGYQAADNLAIGANNIVIGYNIDAVTSTAANTLNIGNLIYGTNVDGSATTVSTGNIGIGTSSPNARLTIQSTASSSDFFNVATTTGASVFRVLANSNVELSAQLIDSGVTWTARTAAGDNDGWQAVTYGNGLFVAVGAVGDRVMTSPDGINWTARTAAGNNDNWRNVTYGNGLFVAVADSGGDRVMTSPDGVTWTARSAAGNDDSWQGVTYANGLFVAVGDSSGTGDSIITSPDGINWTARSAAGDDDGWNSITYGNGLFVAVNTSSLDPVMYSSDGVTWATTTAAGNNDAWGGITYGKGLFVAVGGFGDRVMTSPDAINWTARSASGGLQAVTYGNGLFVASGDTGTYISTSPDGINWTTRSAAGNNDFWYGITYGNGMFVAVGTAGDFVITSGSINESRLASNNLYQGPTSFRDVLNIGTTTTNGVLSIQGQTGTTTNLLTIASSTGTNLLTFTGAGNLGIGTAAPTSLLTVAGTAQITGTTTLATTSLTASLLDFTGSAGTNGMVLLTTGTTTRWVATSTLGISAGAGVSTFLALTDTPSSFTANRLFFTNSGATAVTDSANLTFDGSQFATLNLAVTGTSTFSGTSTMATTSITGNVGIGTTTSSEKLTVVGNMNLSGNASTIKLNGINWLSASTSLGNFVIGGPNTGSVTTGSSNIFIGEDAGAANSGSNNTYLGHSAAARNGGSNSVALGTGAGYGNGGVYTAQEIVLVGAGAGFSLQNGADFNTFIGRESGSSVLSGAGNTFLGYRSGDNLTTGSNSIAIGYDIDFASTTGSNQLNIGNLIFGTGVDGTGATLSSGNIGIGTTSPLAKLTVAGTFLATGTSTLATTTIASSTIGTLNLSNALSLAMGGTGATTAAGARTNLGATTVGSNIFTLTNPSSSTLLRLNADNTVSAISTSTLNIDLGNTVGTLGATRGGTGLASYSTGDLIYASGANTLANRTIGSTGNILSVVGGVPTWVATSSLNIAGLSLFTDGGATTYPTSLNENFGVGTTSSTSKLTVQGDSGSLDIFNVASSTGASVLKVMANSNVELSGQLIDAGVTWTARPALGENDSWTSVTYGNGLFVAVSQAGDRIMTSPDGINWTARSITGNNDTWNDVTYGNGMFVAIGSGTGDYIATSPDGINWTARALAGSNGYEDITYGNGRFVAVGTGPFQHILTSPDGINWTASFAPGNNDGWTSVVYGDGKFVAVSLTGDRVMYSTDGTSWATTTAAGDNDSWASVTYGNGQYVAVADSGDDRIMTSPDGITWTGRSALGNDETWAGVTYGNGLFVAVSGAVGLDRIATSPDGINWTSRRTSSRYADVAYGNGMFVAVGYNGDHVLTSGYIRENRLATNNVYQDISSFVSGLNVGSSTTASSSSTGTLMIFGRAGSNPFSVASSSGTNLLTLTSAGQLGLGSSSPSSLLTVAGTAQITGTTTLATTSLSASLLDFTGSAGTLGMVLQTTGTTTRWVATSTLGISSGSSFTNSAQLAALLSDETGSTNGGVAVFSYAPTFTGLSSFGSTTNSGLLTVAGTTTLATTTIASSTIGTLNLTNALAVAMGGTGATTQSGARTNLGATTIGSNIFTLTNPSSSTILRLNADNTVSALSTSSLNIDLGNTVGTLGGTRGGTGLSTVTNNQLLIGGAGNTWTQAATTTLGLATPFSTSAQLAALLSDETGSTNNGVAVYSYAPTFTGLASFGSTTNSGILTVAGTSTLATTSLTRALLDVGGSSGTNGMVLLSTGTSTRWAATSTLGITGGGGSSLFTDGGATTYLTAVGDNLGIGTTSASEKLTVNGNINLLGNTAALNWNGDRILSASTTLNNYIFGQYAGDSITDGGNNIAIGYNALTSVDTGSGNVSIGTNAGLNNTLGSDNVFIGGGFTGYSNTEGTDNIFIGYAAGGNNTTGSGNVMIGNSAGNALVSGGDNTVYGRFAALSLSTTSQSTIVGHGAAYGIAGAYEADNLTIFGREAGYNLQTGANNNILIGYNAADSLTTGANNLIIGYDVEAPSNTASNQLNIGNLIFGTGIDGVGTTLSSGNIGIGTTSPMAKLTVAGTFRATATSTLSTTTLTAALLDVGGNSGTNGMVLLSTGTSTRWAATSTLGISSGASTFLSLTDTPSSFTSGRVMYTNPGATALTDSANFLFDGSRLATLNLAVTGTSTFSGTTTMASTSISGTLQMGTTSLASRFVLDVNNFSTAGIAGLNRFYTSTNAASGTVQFGEQAYFKNSATATTTIVGSMFRIEDNGTLGNTVRGLEVQANRGTNTQGENTALSGFARTFGVRGFSSGDAGSRFEPAGGYFETGGTTQGNAIRGYSSTITSANLLALFQDTSTFAGTGLNIDLGNGTGSFTGKFVDLKVAGSSRFNVASTGTMFTIGDISITATNTDPAANNVVGQYFGANGFASINRSANPAMNLGRSNDGAVLQFYSAGAVQGSVSIAGATVSYNAFTGSHFGLVPADAATSSYEKGTLLELTGENEYYNDDATSEIVYGMQKTTTENSSRVIGTYLASLEPSRPQSTTNPTLVMAVGNGHMWVADQGEDIKAGDYLISSNIAGHAEKDNSTSSVSYIIARASEDIEWSDVDEDVDGVKHKLITVFFENFTRPNVDFALVASSTIGLADVPEDSFTDSFLTGLFAKITQWVGDAQNGIGDMYANVFNAKERICVDGECLTADDIRNLKGALQSGGSSNPPPSNGGAPGASEPPPAGGGTGDAGGGESDDGESGGGETGDAPDEAPPGAGDGESGGGETGDAPDEAPPGAGDSGGGSEAPPAGGDEGGSGDQGSSGG